MTTEYKKSKFTIRTSGRRVFRRCLRKWGFQSSMRMNLERKGTEQNIHFWFGSAIHFAMEDYFGYNKFGDPRRAFEAYYNAFPESERPEGAADHYLLGMSMLDYFMEWYPKHNQVHEFETLWLDANNNVVKPFTEGARPMVEEAFTLDLGLKALVHAHTHEFICEYDSATERYVTTKYGVDGEASQWFTIEKDGELVEVEVEIIPVCYHGTVDRVCIDKYGRWWILDYKTAKGADTNKLDTDDQISAYMWALEQWLQHPIQGFIYLQMTKDFVKPPKRLKTGALSTDKKQKTTYQLYKAELIKDYGEVSKAPSAMVTMLNHLADMETPEGDRFIRWDLVYRTAAQKIATYNHIIGEAKLMLDPNLYLFPNPTRDCIWDCPFRDVCLALDDDREEEAYAILDSNYEERPRTEDQQEPEWLSRIAWPDKPITEAYDSASERKVSDDNIFNIVLPDCYK